VLVSVLLAGVIPENFPVNTWHSVVWLTLASSASYVLRDDNEWQIAYALLGSIHTTVAVVANHRGDTVYEPRTGLNSKPMIYSLKVVLSDPKRANWPSKKCTLEATGLGSDLSFPDKAEIIARTDRHKQNIYGPSMTTVEPFADCHIFGKTAITALGISKAAHEFLVLHYFATDSRYVTENPCCTITQKDAPHLLSNGPAFRIWEAPIFQHARVWQRTSRVAIRGFSAGSYVGLALVHVLKEIKSVRARSVLGAIACPPSFLCAL